MKRSIEVEINLLRPFKLGCRWFPSTSLSRPSLFTYATRRRTIIGIVNVMSLIFKLFGVKSLRDSSPASLTSKTVTGVCCIYLRTVDSIRVNCLSPFSPVITSLIVGRIVYFMMSIRARKVSATHLNSEGLILVESAALIVLFTTVYTALTFGMPTKGR